MTYLRIVRMDNGKRPLTHPLYIHIKEKGRTIFEKSFEHLPIMVGRSADCEVLLSQYNWISRKHATITQKSDGIYLKDLKSSNGMKVNGKALKEVKLLSGMNVTIGGLTFHFEIVYKSEDGTVKLSEAPSPVPAPPTPPIPRDGSKAKALSTNQRKTPKPQLKPLGNTSDFEPAEDSGPALGLLGEGFEGGLESLSADNPYANIRNLRNRLLAVEVFVSWKGQVIDSVLCRRGETLYAGRGDGAIYVPTFKSDRPILDFRKQQAVVHLPSCKGFLNTPTKKESLSDSQLKSHRKPTLALDINEALSIELGSDIHLHIRYASAPRQLTKKPIGEIDTLMKKAVGSSTFGHFLLFLLAILMPKDPAPKIKNLPPRVAKLLVQKPKKKPEPPKPKEPKKPEPKKVAKKKKPKPAIRKVVRKRKIRKPRKVVVKPSKRMKRINKVVARVSNANRSKPKKKQKNVQSLGALAALGALGAPTPNPMNKAVALNINPNAGGAAPSKMKTSGLIGSLKSKSGRLPPGGGMVGVRTKGKGFGTGTGYGVQGIKGSAGSRGRGVAGVVVGTPRLMKVKRDEGLTQKQVMKIVKKKAGKIQQCYERALLSSPGIQGRVEYNWYITPRGKVKWAKVKNSSVRNADVLNACVIKVFMSMRFPKAKNGASTQPSIGFPFGRM